MSRLNSECYHSYAAPAVVVSNQPPNSTAGVKEYKSAVEARERAQSVRITKGLRQSWGKFNIGRRAICKESNAERDARAKRKRARRFTLSSFTLAMKAYVASFEDAVGCSEAEYLKKASHHEQRHILEKYGKEAYLQNKQEVDGLNAKKLNLIAGTHPYQQSRSPMTASLLTSSLMIRIPTDPDPC